MEIEKNLDFMRQDYSILGEGAAEEVLRKNNKLYREMKGDYTQHYWDVSGNIKYTAIRDGKWYHLLREQQNINQIIEECKALRALSEQGIPHHLAPIDTGADKPKLSTTPWVHVPSCIDIDISNKYFGGIPWDVIKMDPTLKTQYYMVIQREYPMFICYPGGKLPIKNADKIPYPSKEGEVKYFKGH